MAMYELDGQGPELPADGSYFVADTATVIGKVRLQEGASVWFGAVLRGDNEWIEIGEGSNVQDNSTCHTDPGLSADRSARTVPSATTSSCTAAPSRTSALVGMGSIVMNGAQDRPRQRCRRRRGHHRGQGVSRKFADHRRAGARDPHADAGAIAGDGTRGEILSAQRPAFQSGPEEDRLTRCAHAFVDGLTAWLFVKACPLRSLAAAARVGGEADALAQRILQIDRNAVLLEEVGERFVGQFLKGRHPVARKLLQLVERCRRRRRSVCACLKIRSDQ